MIVNEALFDLFAMVICETRKKPLKSFEFYIIQKDEQFKENMLRKLESKREFIELPYNLQHLLIAEDTEEFPESRFLLRNEEKV